MKQFLTWLAVIALVVALPIPFLAALWPPNKYEPQGFVGIDCDSSLTVHLLVISSYVIYGSAMFVFARLSWKTKRMYHIVGALLCSLVVVAVTPNLVKANDPKYSEGCR
ncbi:MAG: hypothetical protein U1D69_08690 [Polynucleobacter sp.]|nr:hypothetical protein [Polynucleobacter sp.]